MEIKIYCKDCKYFDEGWNVVGHTPRDPSCEHSICIETEYDSVNGPFQQRKEGFDYGDLNKNYDCKYYVEELNKNNKIGKCKIGIYAATIGGFIVILVFAYAILCI